MTLTPEEVANVLKLTVRTVYEYLRSGKLPGRKVGGTSWRILESDLEDFIRTGGVRVPGCIAYTDDESLCRKPATVLDPERGGMVCDGHAPKDSHT